LFQPISHGRAFPEQKPQAFAVQNRFDLNVLGKLVQKECEHEAG
jgi:hypothetical protein